MADRYDDGMSAAEAAMLGAVAGLLGGVVMKAVWEAEQRALLPEAERLGSPTRDTIEVLARQRGAELSEAQLSGASAVVFGGSMAVWGAIYGVVQSRLHPPDALHGLLLGGLLYAANFPKATGVLPKLGVVAPPSEQSPRQNAVVLGAHAAFGLTTAAAFSALS